MPSKVSWAVTCGGLGRARGVDGVVLDDDRLGRGEERVIGQGDRRDVGVVAGQGDRGVEGAAVGVDRGVLGGEFGGGVELEVGGRRLGPGRRCRCRRWRPSLRGRRRCKVWVTFWLEALVTVSVTELVVGGGDGGVPLEREVVGARAGDARWRR